MIDKIKIGHYNYEIIEEDNLKFGDDLINGLCSYQDKKIKLESNLQSEMKKGVLIHEVLHGLFGESGLSFSLDDDTEEEYVVLLSNSLHGFLKDNIEQLHEMYSAPDV